MKLPTLLLRHVSLVTCLAVAISSTGITTAFASNPTNNTSNSAPPQSATTSTSQSVSIASTVVTQTYSPEIDSKFKPVFPTIKETLTAGDNGTLVSTLVGNSITVKRSNGQPDIAVVGTTGLGTWEVQYSAGGTWWNINPGGISATSDTYATMIHTGEKIRFRPAVNWNGTATITYRAWDGVNDPGANQSARTILDVSTNGADTNYSADTQTASIVVTPVNTPPDVIFPITPKTLTFDGSTKYVNMPTVNLPQNFTFETWVKSTNPTSTWNRIFDFGNGQASSNVYLGYENNTGKMQLMSYRGSTGTAITTSNVFPTNTWVHVAITIDNQGNASIYWNGIVQASGNIGITEQITRTKNFVGRSNWVQDAYFQGQLRDIRMWNVVRTAQQIRDSYPSLLSGKEANLFTYLPAIEGQGTVLGDTSGHFNSATIVGAQWVNDPTVPPTSTMMQNTNSSTDLNRSYVQDVDFVETPNAKMTVTLDTYNGVVNLNTSSSGVTIVQGGNNQASITLRGDMTQINEALIPLQYIPNHNFNGIDKLNFTVNDEGNTGEGGALTTFKTVYLNVIPVNQAPTITAIADQSLFVNQSTQALPFTVDDFETAASALTVTVSSSDTQFVPLSGIVISGSGASRTVTVTPTSAATGNSTITLTVSDGTKTTTTTFKVTASVDLDGSLDPVPNNGTLFKSPGDTLTLKAISSIQDDRVVANVYGQDVELTLANPTTYLQDGYKQWSKPYTLPATVPSGAQNVVFKALSTNGTTVETEKNTLLQNNTFTLLKTPVANTAQTSNVSPSGGTLAGEVVESGGTAVMERGFVYSTNALPTIGQGTQMVATLGSGTGTFSTPVTNLNSNTTYYSRAYVKTSQGVFYGSPVSFKTLWAPVANTAQASNVSTSGGTLAGVALDDGGTPITERGFVYSTNGQPTIGQDTKLIDTNGTGTGNFNQPVTGLTSNTTYYARSYIVTSQGITYGNTVSFKTLSTPVATTAQVNNVSMSGGTFAGVAVADGGTPITERGFVYATNSQPVYGQDNKLVDTTGTGTGNFNQPVTGLTSNTKYYARAYVKTSQGVFYGNTVSFTTLAAPVATTAQASNIGTSGGTLTGTAVSDGGIPITERGFVYSTNSQPVIGQDTKLVDTNGTGTGNFSQPLTGLNSSTTYYARAYVVNAQGVFYGNTISFTTSKASGGGGGAVTPVATSIKIAPQIIDPATGKTEAKANLIQYVGTDLKVNGQLIDATGKVVNANLSVNPDGSFIVPAALPAGSYSMVMQIAAPNGQKLAGTRAQLSVNSQGGATMKYDLVDPYGTITDLKTGQPISGVKLQIYWADTALNRAQGRIPNTLVDLPELPQFMPNQNHVPQWSTDNGEYGWMVFGNGDYYILAQHDGYAPYDSRQDMRDEKHGADSYIQNGLIHVGTEIVNYNFGLKPNAASIVREPYMRGYPDGKFYPERGLSRAELAAILARVLEQNAPTQADIAFKDIASTKWANKSIHTSTEQGWLKGYPGKKFEPARAVTRAEFAQVLANISQWNMDDNAPITFKDVNKHWAADAIAKAVNHHMLSGDINGLFHPNEPITRSDAITAFNLLLNRQPAAELSKQVWPDVPTSYPNYANIMEASVKQTIQQ
ncbi:LamG-like jellyroll fold domain-containing protein [Paenibacillus sp. SGZ-1009]|uniref:LamG-like jellyroll fold domain-containing protein n=1 Tax=Paenibacillus campi TaxID=3106031 RepID=UPI002AFEA7BE|nr:LamG-like jellyroll fold domain-containing protein [Paenibacillus sp. SGZ-1009]